MSRGIPAAIIREPDLVPGVRVLLLKPNCECCDADLPPASADALICTFECTFCAGCAREMNHVCPNCGGNLVMRPVRPEAMLARHPASTERVLAKEPCPHRAAQ